MKQMLSIASANSICIILLVPVPSIKGLLTSFSPLSPLRTVPRIALRTVPLHSFQSKQRKYQVFDGFNDLYYFRTFFMPQFQMMHEANVDDRKRVSDWCNYLRQEYDKGPG
jgi:hypothetical protein